MIIEEFLERVIKIVSKLRGISDADKEDIIQQVVTTFIEYMARFKIKAKKLNQDIIKFKVFTAIKVIFRKQQSNLFDIESQHINIVKNCQETPETCYIQKEFIDLIIDNLKFIQEEQRKILFLRLFLAQRVLCGVRMQRVFVLIPC